MHAARTGASQAAAARSAWRRRRCTRQRRAHRRTLDRHGRRRGVRLQQRPANLTDCAATRSVVAQHRRALRAAHSGQRLRAPVRYRPIPCCSPPRTAHRVAGASCPRWLPARDSRAPGSPVTGAPPPASPAVAGSRQAALHESSAAVPPSARSATTCHRYSGAASAHGAARATVAKDDATRKATFGCVRKRAPVRCFNWRG